LLVLLKLSLICFS